MTPVQDGPSCPGCGLANYSGLCPVCRGDEEATRREGLPYPWAQDDAPEPCPMGCGRTTGDPYGGPCKACWDKVT